MGLFGNLFGPKSGAKTPGPSKAWQTLTAYRPVFSSFSGELYESELVRASIDALARHSAKLECQVVGSALPQLRTRLRSGPNPWMSWYQYLYRLRTILEMQNTAFIIPFEVSGDLLGYFPILPSSCELVEAADGEPWLRYRMVTGETAALPLDEVGIMTRHQYRSDFFGESNGALASTMELIEMQRQGITEAAKNSATYRFMARVNNFMDPDDLELERKRFDEHHLVGESGGLLLFPNLYSDIQQIDQKAYTVDADQMQLIQTNVYNYFGVNQDVLQNSLFGDAWSAFYEGAIEPFAIQASEVHTVLTYSPRERGTGNKIFFTSNRLQYMSNQDKLAVSAQLVDRGVLSINDSRAIWNLPPIEDEAGDAHVIRGEYRPIDQQLAPKTEDEDKE